MIPCVDGAMQFSLVWMEIKMDPPMDTATLVGWQTLLNAPIARVTQIAETAIRAPTADGAKRTRIAF